MSGAADQFGKHIKAVATELWGEPRKGGTKTEVRFGDGRTINPEKGTWWRHGDDVGGGTLDLIIAEGKATDRKEAVDWMIDRGFPIEGRRQAERGSNRNAGPTHGDDGASWEIVKTWDYVDENGALLFQVCRLENGLIADDGKPEKSYRQRRPNPSQRDGWTWKTKGMRMVPYRLPEVMEAIAAGNTIFIVEGEKAADRLWDEGVPATTNARGAGKWVEELNAFFRGARVVVIPDNDPQMRDKHTGELKFHPDGRPIYVGQDHAEAVAAALEPIAKDTRLLELPDLPPKGDVVEWFADLGGTIDRLYDLAGACRKFEARPFRSAFNAIPWTHMDDPAPEHEQLIKGVVTRGEVGMVAGPSKSGKTFIVLDIAMAVTRGVEWMGRRVRHGGVIYQAGEGQKGIKKRIRAYRVRHGVPVTEPLPFVLMPARINLYKDDDQTNAFIAEAKYWASTFKVPLELIVIDTWATATTGANENDGKDVGAVLERGARISQATGACVLFVHHMNAEGSKIRGHTSILGNLENVLLVRQVEGLRDDDHRQLREIIVDKNKDGEDGTKIRFVLAQVVLGEDADGDNITSCVVYPPNGEDRKTEDAPGGVAITARETVLIRAMERALDEYGMKPPAETQLPVDLRVVDWRRVLTAYDRLTFDDMEVDEDEAGRKKRLDARRKELKRLGETLLQKNIIGREAPLVWLTGKHKERRRQAASAVRPSDPSAPPVEPDDNPGHLWGDD